MSNNQINMVFTVCNGRCGQHSLGDYLNRYALDTLAEVEPPNLFYPNHFPFGNYMRNFQRKWFVTDEMLGRGRALDWYRLHDKHSLIKLSSSRLQRIENIIQKQNLKNYFEISKFFIRSYFETTQELVPNLGVLMLRRDPISNAKSFVNRHKSFILDNQLPNESNVILKMDPDKLSPFQLYLWKWCEIELRYKNFIQSREIRRHFEVSNTELSNPKILGDMMDHFSIDHVDVLEMRPLEPINTNVEKGLKPTHISAQDFWEFESFLKMLPTYCRKKLLLLDFWHAEYKKLDYIN